MRVLIAEDDRLQMHLLAAEFRRHDVRAVQAFSAEEARTLVRRDPAVHLLVLDLALFGPGGAEPEPARALVGAAVDCRVPILVIGHRATRLTDRDSRLADAAAHIIKPIVPAAVVAAAAKVVSEESGRERE